MKYSILGFNQEVVLTYKKTVIRKIKGVEKETEVRIDVTDLLIINTISDFMNRPNIIKSEVEGKNYFWVNYSTLLEDLPILDITKQGLADRLDKLHEFNIIEKKVVKNEMGTFTCFRMGEDYEKLKYSSKLDGGGSCSTTNGGSSQLRTGVVVNYEPNMNTLNNEYAKKEKKEDTNVSKKVSFSKNSKPNDEQVKMFEEFRKLYPGQKRGLNTELSLLVKKHSDWADIIPLLKLSLEAEIRKREEAEYSKTFFPKPQHLQTYINQRSWEKYIDDINLNYYNEYHPATDGEITYIESTNRYITHMPLEWQAPCDGYTDDNRPDGAELYYQGIKSTWSREQKKWVKDGR